MNSNDGKLYHKKEEVLFFSVNVLRLIGKGMISTASPMQNIKVFLNG